jgi:hypothetical protein
MFDWSRRSLPWPVLSLVGAMLLGVVFAMAAVWQTASAHYSTSKATRLGQTQVLIDARVAMPDACTSIARLSTQAPPGVTLPSTVLPVSINLQRPAEALCAQVITPVRLVRHLSAHEAIKALQVYVLRPDGGIMSSEAVILP